MDDARPQTTVESEGEASPLAGSPDRFINRELSWLAFNERVLEEASNPAHPLLERLRFVSISAANLDEFYMVRVAGLKSQIRAGIGARSADGLTPQEQLHAVNERARTLMREQQRCWHELREAMREQGIELLDPEALDQDERAWLTSYFVKEIFPALTPVAIDPAHPFPFIPNLGFSLVLSMKRPKDEETSAGLVALPTTIDRFVRLESRKSAFVTLEHVVRVHLDLLFPGFDLLDVGVFRVLRDSDVEIEEEAEDLVRESEELLRRRRRGSVIRLKINADVPAALRSFVVERLGVGEEDVFDVDGLLGLAETARLILRDRPDLEFEPYTPRFPERISDHDGDCFAAIRQKDIIVHHPYESFDVVVSFLRQAAKDPNVVAIKQTLYRTGEDFADRGGAARGRRAGQVGDRADRAQGAVRRGAQHPLGARSRTRRRPGGVRLRPAQDPRQDLAGGAPRTERASRPTPISAPATTTRSTRGSIPICRISPATPRSAATRRSCSTT